MAEVAMDKPKKIHGFDEWEVRNAAETLTRAFEIKSKPKLLAAAMKMVNEQRKAAEAVQGWASKMKG